MSEDRHFCQLCGDSPVFYSFASLYKHINLVHDRSESFKLRCELTPLCGSIYTSFPSYKCHIYRHHRNLIPISFAADNISVPNDQANSVSIAHHVDDEMFEHPTNNPNNQNSQSSCENSEEMIIDYPLFMKTIAEPIDGPFHMAKFRKYYTKFLLELREKHLLPQNIVTSITANFSILLHFLLKSMQTAGSDVNAASTVISMIDVEKMINQAIRTIEDVAKNEYQFIKNCKEFFQYVEPQKIELSEYGDYGYVIPIKNTIQNFLSKPDVLDLLIKNTNETILAKNNDNDLLLTYRDGTAARENISIKHHTDSFLLQLYTDEVGITNPIGPKKDEKKLSLFYYILEDLPSVIRSLLDSVHLVGICLSKSLSNSSHRQTYFNKIINDLNDLQTNGLTLPTCSGRVYFTFTVIAADNLAANELGGFQKNFSSGHFCRMCCISYDYKSIPLTNVSFLSRCEKSYERHLNKSLEINDFVVGVSGSSDLSKLIAFHPVKSLPFDIMHDYSEGVCMIVVKSILKAFSTRRILTYAQIEERFECFIYGQNDSSNKPPTVRPKHIANNHIAGSASQKLLLFQILPIVFYDVIHLLTDLLPVYTCLREIVSIVFASRIRKSWLSYLTYLTISFHALMIEKLPDNITAKVHFVTHYSELIKRNGPAKNYWCQRFEGKHLYFKKLAMQSSNFKNIPYTLAKRHQLRLSLLLSYENFYDVIDKPVSIKTIKSSQFPNDIKNLLEHYQFNSLTYNECQTLIYKHVKFIKNSVFIRNLLHEEEVPVFVLLRHILKLENSWKLIVQHLETLSFDHILWSYEINYLEKYSIINLDECLHILPHGLDIYSIKNSSFVNILTRLTK